MIIKCNNKACIFSINGICNYKNLEIEWRFGANDFYNHPDKVWCISFTQSNKNIKND